MGIPKFFRWLSERYPLCSQLISEHNVPEFDNFYLDMNGIIHTCSRAIASSGLPYTEADMFVSIFAYLQALVEKIRPKKVLFLAVDGVAPRAKLNQQRARRFRSAKEAQIEAEKALQKHQKSPLAKVPLTNQERFDSNCITPGTEFMHRMSTHLRFFIAQRMAEDIVWQNIDVIFSGPDVPGEGEHKIMEYIRLNKARLDYDPNIRHCLYGLDADLILLGLLSHDPHFALLREEVVFGRGVQAKKSASETKFYLLHLCLLREYMDLEFSKIAGPSHSLERLLDDFILLMCFIGNDFLPNLPHFHLGEGVLETLFESYKLALPSFNGEYLNDNGRISYPNIALVLKELINFEKTIFSSAEPSMFSGKVQDKSDKKAVLLRSLLENFLKNPGNNSWSTPKAVTGGERQLLTDVAKKLELFFKIDGAILTLSKSREITEGELIEFEGIVEEWEESPESKIEKGWNRWKREYYISKLHFDTDSDKESLNKMLRDYAEGLQWNMYYYYEGVASWSWFYPYHYAPHISDLAKYCEEFVCDPFDLSRPLLPLEQLMAVLPPASKALVPPALATLMTSPSSPLIDFYPTDFKTDANGKKASWEAIVMIPFIDETVLLPALMSKAALLTSEERSRNQFGNTVLFEYRRPGRRVDPPSSEFRLIEDCPVHEVIYELPVLQPNERFIAALCRGVRIGIHAMPGFPTLATLPVVGLLDSGIGLDIFGQVAKGLSMVITINQGGIFGHEQLANIAERIINQRVYINWPHLRVGKVEFITDGCRKYSLDHDDKLIMSEVDEIDNFQKMCDAIEKEYRKRCAVLTGPIGALVWIRPFIGMTMSADGSTTKLFDEAPVPFALQTIVEKRINQFGEEVEDTRFEESSIAGTDVSTLFPSDSAVIYLGSDSYGCIGRVIGYPTEDERLVNIQMQVRASPEPTFPRRLASEANHKLDSQFVASSQICPTVGISPLLLSKLASSLTLFLDEVMIRSANLGLDLKSDGKRIQAVGYARKTRSGWEYSKKVVDLLIEMKSRFPSVLANLEAEKSSHNLDAKKIFPKVTDRESLMGAVAPFRAFIDSRISGIIHVSIDGEFLDSEGIDTIKRSLNDYMSSRRQTRQEQVLTVPIESIISPATSVRLRKQPQSFVLGDRIVSVASGLFGQYGTVVGSFADKLSILLDKPAIGGNDLGGLVEEGWGMILDRDECLNLNKPQPPAGTKAMKTSQRTVQSKGQPDLTVQSKEQPSPTMQFRGQSHQEQPHQGQPSLLSRQPRSIKVEELFGMINLAEPKQSERASKSAPILNRLPTQRPSPAPVQIKVQPQQPIPHIKVHPQERAPASKIRQERPPPPEPIVSRPPAVHYDSVTKKKGLLRPNLNWHNPDKQ